MTAKLKAALDLRAAGLSAGQIAAELEVNARTVRKWWAKARKLAGADGPPAEIEAIDPTDPTALGDAMRRLVARETGAALALSQRDPGAATDALGRLARALKHIPTRSAAQDADDEPTADELAATLADHLDNLAGDTLRSATAWPCPCCGAVYAEPPPNPPPQHAFADATLRGLAARLDYLRDWRAKLAQDEGAAPEKTEPA